MQQLSEFSDKKIDSVLSMLYLSENKRKALQLILIDLSIPYSGNAVEVLKLKMVNETRLADLIGNDLVISKRGGNIVTEYGGWLEFLTHIQNERDNLVFQRNHIRQMGILTFWIALGAIIASVYYILAIWWHYYPCYCH